MSHDNLNRTGSVRRLVNSRAASPPVRPTLFSGDQNSIAAAGDLDGSFNGSGKVTVSISPHTGTTPPHDVAYAVALQADSKIVAAGYAADGFSSGPPPPEQFALVRLNTDGSLDTSFNGNGIVTTQVSPSTTIPNGRALAVAVQADGKIVAAGFATVDSPFFHDDFALARYNSNGTLDSSFGSGGKVTGAFNAPFSTAAVTSLLLQPDGKIIAAGETTSVSGNQDFAIARFNTDGTLDTSFGTGGKVTTDFGSTNDQANALALQADGKIVTAGQFLVQPGDFDYAVARYNTNGTLDSSFGTGGKVTTNVAGFEDAAMAVIVQPDGRILVGGGQPGFEMARFDAQGTLDTSFGNGGKVFTEMAGGAVCNAMALQSDGKILLGGAWLGFLTLERFTSNGIADGSFGTTVLDNPGIAQASFLPDGALAHSMKIQTDGKIIAAGEVDNTTRTSFAFARFLNDVPPTAAPATISGQITTDRGVPLAGVVMRLSGARIGVTITDSLGHYSFSSIDTDNFYTVTPELVNFAFAPHSLSFSLLGNKTDAVFTGTANAQPTANPLDTAEFFVRQQYVDFLGREPDQGGFEYWSSQINQCLSEPPAVASASAAFDCLNARRIDVSAAFFVEQEFQLTGSFIYNLYAAALDRRPAFIEYAADRQQVVGGANLDSAKTAFAEGFVQRPEFVQKFSSSLSADSFVDVLLQSARQATGVDFSDRRASLLNTYTSGANPMKSRALVLRAIADDTAVKQAEYNAAFVLAEYFGYLRRDPDQAGYDFWLSILNSHNYRSMVCAFITSAEYQRRFSLAVTHSNAECSS